GSAPPARTRGLRVSVTSHTRRPVRVPGLAAWLSGAAPLRARGEVALAFVSDGRVRALNRAHRGYDVPTDVLSFPSDEPGFLGDIVIAAGVASRQASRAGHALGVEARVLALHGLLHLLGHAHETDQGQMQRPEARLRRKAGLRAGLIEREGRRTA
ncbi:MAG: rRNA maturation RNase YbeY, partial [Vicinamibacterales bacterium]